MIVLALLAVAMVAVVPSRVPTDPVAADDRGPVRVDTGQPATGWQDGVRSCDAHPQQVEGFDYSPPCYEFSGDNGGATSRGVTDDSVRISYRVTADPSLLMLLGDFGGVPLNETNSDLERTAQGLTDWFNQNFQFYGRQMELMTFHGRGQLLPEFLGAGQDAATNDAIKAANEIEAFADVTGLTQPYADALVRNEVVAVGAPYMSREWFTERRPYAWSIFPDCTLTAEASAMVLNRNLLGDTARHAGDGLNQERRRLAVVAPNNREYQQCMDTFETELDYGGNGLDLRLDYSLDIATLQSQASGLLAKLKSNRITSVSCACDPIMQMYLAQEAQAQNYHPEWLIAGVGFTDLDIGGQILDKNAPEQWGRAFGVSPWAAESPPERSAAYRAYRSVRDDEPSIFVDQLFQELLVLALGIQMAGPDLTPQTFETGLFSLDRAVGEAGAWKFSRRNYTPITDLRLLWWDPDKLSPFNGKPGSYTDNGDRFTREDLPVGQPEVFT